jgi:hypothetical protein
MNKELKIFVRINKLEINLYLHNLMNRKKIILIQIRHKDQIINLKKPL